MKREIFGIIAAAAFCGAPALAADMPVKAPPMAPVVAPAYSWTGFYIGGNGSYEWTDGKTYPLTGTQAVAPNAGVGILSWQAFANYPLTSNLGQRGAIGGLQAGYNWQFNSVVTGIEADFDMSSARRSASTFASAVFAPVTFSSTSNISRRLDDLGTLRVRIGIASDRTLLYATGGLAYVQSKLGYSVALSNGLTPNTAGSASNTTTVWQAGWTLGAGIEYALWQHWSVKAEYLYYDLGTQSTTIVAASPPASNSWTGTATVRNDGQIVRGGLNYKF
jgi:outer membrane immunogenic protein